MGASWALLGLLGPSLGPLRVFWASLGLLGPYEGAQAPLEHWI